MNSIKGNRDQIGRDIKKHKRGCLCVRMRYNENIEYIDTWLSYTINYWLLLNSSMSRIWLSNLISQSTVRFSSFGMCSNIKVSSINTSISSLSGFVFLHTISVIRKGSSEKMADNLNFNSSVFTDWRYTFSGLVEENWRFDQT